MAFSCWYWAEFGRWQILRMAGSIADIAIHSMIMIDGTPGVFKQAHSEPQSGFLRSSHRIETSKHTNSPDSASQKLEKFSTTYLRLA